MKQNKELYVIYILLCNEKKEPFFTALIVNSTYNIFPNNVK